MRWFVDMKDKKARGYRILPIFFQLGASIVLPMVICIAAGVLMNEYWNTPRWLTAVLALLGLFCGLYGVFKTIFKITDSNEKGKGKDDHEKG